LEDNIDWEDAPEGTTHYDPTDEVYPWNKIGKCAWYYYNHGAWFRYVPFEQEDTNFESFIPRPEQTTETTCTEDSYTTPEADPFSEELKKKQSEEAILALYLEAINSKVGQDETEVITMEYLNELFYGDKPRWSSVNGDIKGCVTGEGTVSFAEESLRHLNEWVNEVCAISSEKDSNVSWYDYDKEELTGLPEKGEAVYDRLLQEDVEYLGKLHYEDTVILETRDGKCYDRCITNIKPLNYKDSPTRQARKEQHKLLEDLVRYVDNDLEGYTHEAGAIDLYNKGWRVSKEDV
jgi:hypothetical protein